MKRVSILILAAALAACGGTSFILILDAAVIASTAAIPFCTSFAGAQAQQCVQYAETVNADAEASIPIANDSTLTKAQIALKLLPIWSNVASVTFPNSSPEIMALQAAVAGVIQIIEVYNSQTAASQEHLTVKAADLKKLRTDIGVFRQKVPRK